MKKRLFLDMDGTLARFHDVDKLFIEAMWQQGFYTGLKPFENMVEGVRKFINEHPDVEVYVLSAVLDTEPPFVEDEKNAWLDKYLPEISADRRIFTRAGENKADYIGKIGANDYLVDDYNKNLREFEVAGARSIKFRNDVNHQGKGAYGGEMGPLWNGAIISYDSTPHAIAFELGELLELDRSKIHNEFIKYELTDEIVAIGGLTRIKACTDFTTVTGLKVKKGDLGGFVQGKHNLSQEGSCWVANDAVVCNNAKVFDNAVVSGFAEVSGEASVHGNAVVCDEAWVLGSAEIFDNAKISGTAAISGNAKIFGFAEVCDEAAVGNKVHIGGKTKVYGNKHIYDNSIIGDTDCVSLDMQMTGAETKKSEVCNSDIGNFIDINKER